MSSPLLLIGEHPATLDGEGRIQLPVGLRDEINPRATNFSLMANLEPDGSLCLRERRDWERYVEDLRRSHVESARARRALQFLAAYSGAAKCDKTGRVRIPDALLLQVGLDRSVEGRRDVVLVGNFEDIRVWSPEGWAQFREETRAEYGSGIDDLLGHKRLGPEGLVDRDTA
ncbi:MAG TPA: hypothetical protein P5218_06730 [Planctomycetota bacterium]|mgnify:CR=1 FL=1|nr:hypothetical protein [Planctomycetota bacterium]HRV81109.1 hypothetical protein [Planctomycetota bacterium]